MLYSYVILYKLENPNSYFMYLTDPSHLSRLSQKVFRCEIQLLSFIYSHSACILCNILDEGRYFTPIHLDKFIVLFLSAAIMTDWSRLIYL